MKVKKSFSRLKPRPKRDKSYLYRMDSLSYEILRDYSVRKDVPIREVLDQGVKYVMLKEPIGSEYRRDN